MIKTGRTRKAGARFATISLPVLLIEEVERIVEEFRYWPHKTDFVREAVLEYLERYRKENGETEARRRRKEKR